MKVIPEWELKHSKKVGKTYKNNIGRFIQACNFAVESGSYSDVLSYVSLLRSQGMSSRNLRNHLCAIKFYYSCLLDLGYINHHPCRGLLLKDKIDKRIDVEVLYSQEELDLLLQRDFSRSLKILVLRNKLLVQFLVYQGLRVKELVSLKVSDIDLESCQVRIVGSRELPLVSQQILSLHKYIKEDREILRGLSETSILLLSKSGKPLPSETISSIINYKERQRFIPVRVRQSVISLLLKRGEDLRKVQLFAGHSYVSSTESYLSNDLTDLKQALEKHHPLG